MKETNNHSGFTETNDDFDIQACASMDCTGLIPALPVSESELESYEALYSYLPVAKKEQDP